MSKSLSSDAVDALRHLSEVHVGEAPPLVSMGAAAELMSAGLAGENNNGVIEITCDGRKYLSGDCD